MSTCASKLFEFLFRLAYTLEDIISKAVSLGKEKLRDILNTPESPAKISFEDEIAIIRDRQGSFLLYILLNLPVPEMPLMLSSARWEGDFLILEGYGKEKYILKRSWETLKGLEHLKKYLEGNIDEEGSFYSNIRDISLR